MHLLHHLSELKRFQKPVCMTLGVFDGVHLGHQKVIHEVVLRARNLSGEAALLTFHPHPAKVVRPQSAPSLLTTEQQDCELFSTLNVDVCLILDFNEKLSQYPAIDFLNQILEAVPTLHTLVVGHDWHFGHGREGDFHLLKTWATSHGKEAIEVSPVTVNGEIVSSTVIRRQIAFGDIQGALARLGRPYQIVGRVVRGDGIGAQIGFPTANLEVESELLPSPGVYAARALVEGEVFAAAVNIGSRPTVSKSGEIKVEAHLLGFQSEIYGFHLRLDFLARLRDEKTFKNLDELKNQIEADSKAALQIASE